jgi:RHS repeat-associated protein
LPADEHRPVDIPLSSLSKAVSEQTTSQWVLPHVCRQHVLSLASKGSSEMHLPFSTFSRSVRRSRRAARRNHEQERLKKYGVQPRFDQLEDRFMLDTVLAKMIIFDIDPDNINPTNPVGNVGVTTTTSGVAGNTDPLTSYADRSFIQAGNVSVFHPLDVDKGPGRTQYGDYGLLYNSNTAGMKPIVQVEIQTDPGQDLPPNYTLTLSGAFTGSQTLSTAGVTKGDLITLAVQAGNSVTTGYYSWTVTVLKDYAGTANDVTYTKSGKTVIANLLYSVSLGTSTLGAGWSVSNVDRLVVDENDCSSLAPLCQPFNYAIRLFGSGGHSYYIWDRSKFKSPAGDNGVLDDVAGGGFVYTSATGEKRNFDSNGLQTSLVSADGQETTTFTYTNTDGWGVADDLETILTPDGARATFTYASNKLSSINTSTGLYTVTHDASNNITVIKNPDNGLRTFTYDTPSNNRLTDEDFDTYTGTWAYDSYGAATGATQGSSITDVGPTAVKGLGTIIKGSPLATVTDPLDNVTTWTLDSDGRPTENKTADGNGWKWVRDDQGRVIVQIDPLNRPTVYVRDDKGFIVKETLPGGNIRTYRYTQDAFHRLAEFKNERGFVSRYSYDSAGRLLTATDALNQTTSYAYYSSGTSNGLLRDVTDALGRVTSLGYDSSRRLTTVIEDYGTSKLNVTTTVAYTSAGNVLSTTNPRGTVTSYGYDAMNRVTKIIEDQGSGKLNLTTTIAYTAAGAVLYVTNARGVITSFAYDSAGRQTRVIEANGSGVQRTTTIAYNAAGFVSTITDALSNVLTYGYDNMNHVVSVTLPDPDGGGSQTSSIWTTVYDAVGNVIETMDPLNHSTAYVYNLRDRVVLETDAEGGRIVRTYDGVGNPLTLTDPVGNSTAFEYDPLNRQITETNALGMSHVWQYDAVGNVTLMIDRNARRRVFTYDNMNRLTLEEWIDGNTTVRSIGFTYDANSNLLTIGDADSLYTHTYDAADRRTREQGVWSTSLTLTLDANGNVTKIDDYFGGVTTSTYDDLDRLTQRQFNDTDLAPVRVDLTYTARDEYASITRWSNLGGTTKVGSTLYTFDNAGRLTNLRHRNASDTVFWNGTYGYDAAHRMTSDVLGSDTVSFTHDDTDQLTGASGARTESYSYDANGNRNMTGWVTAPNNRLVHDPNWIYEYDPEGNLIRRVNKANEDVWWFSYDYLNRVVGVTRRSVVNTVLVDMVFMYDVFGNRIQKRVDTDGDGDWDTTTRSAYHNNMAWADLNDSNALTMHYVSGDQIDQLFARITSGGTVSWYLPDQIGSTRGIVNNSGTSLGTLVYDSFGNQLSGGGDTDFDRFRFTGREWDAELGMYYYRARLYDPTTARFTSQDPIGFAAGDANLYRYAHNSPMIFTDPLGEVKVEVRYIKIGSFGRDYYHAFIVLTDNDGKQYYCRGGPEEGSSSGPIDGSSGGYGKIVTQCGEYTRGTIDWTPDELPSVTIIDDPNKRAADYYDKLRDAMRRIEDRKINYDPFGCNSNSTAHDAIQVIGFPRPVAPVWAPGHNCRLLPETKPPTKPSSWFPYNGGACFVAGTFVHTRAGLKRIEQVCRGDEVRSWNEERRQFEFQPVIHPRVTDRENLVQISGETWAVTCSPEHPFLLETYEWRRADELKNGDKVLSASGTPVSIRHVTRENIPGTRKVYNFEVKETHTYCVTEMGLVVHNKT